MGTTYTVKVYGVLTPEQLNGLRGDIAGALEAVNASMSTYRSDSELSRFNLQRSSSPFAASPQLLTVMGLAQQISEASGGAFDITVGPLVNAYGFGPDGRERRPDEAKLAELRARVGFRKVTLQEAALVKAEPSIYCDLSAIAKGWGVDEVARVVEARGLKRYLVEVGGELRGLGHNAHDRPWRVGIETPSDTGRGGVQQVVSLDGRAMATSGDYRNFYREDGRRVSHTIDARTGRPVTHELASVTVIHTSAALADGWATALTVLGPIDGPNLAERLGLAAYFIQREPDGTFTGTASAAFKALGAQPAP